MSNFFYFPLSDFFLRILSILTHTQEERRKGFKETNSDVYPKLPNYPYYRLITTNDINKINFY